MIKRIPLRGDYPRSKDTPPVKDADEVCGPLGFTLEVGNEPSMHEGWETAGTLDLTRTK
jgi:hypothetical protein